MKEFEKESTIDKLIENTLSNLKTIVDNNTVFGDTIKTDDGTIIIPVSKISIGFVTGGGEYSDLSTRRVGNHYPMAGGSGGGISMTPLGFIVSTNSEVRFIDTGVNDKTDKIFENIKKITQYFVKKKEKENEKK